MPKGQQKTLLAQSRIGESYGLLTIEEWLGSNKYRQAVYRFSCLCGGSIERELVRVKNSGEYASCGCSSNVGRFLHHFKHGNSMRGDGGTSPEYRVWSKMLGRCKPNPNRRDARWYADKGIRVCERWQSFENFLADMGKRPSSEHEIDRINADGDYEPDNCRWIPKLENIRRANKARFERESADKFTAERIARVKAKRASGSTLLSIQKDERIGFESLKKMLSMEES